VKKSVIMQTHVLNGRRIQQKITRIAYQIYEEHNEEREIIIAGIMPGGYILAQRIMEILKKISPLKIQLLGIIIKKKEPYNEKGVMIEGNKDLSGKAVIVCDDVLNTGKVLAYCLKSILNTPVKSLSIAVMVDRNHSNFPMKPDYTGLSIATTIQEHIEVDLSKKGKETIILSD
jgi:pyrimidine operon attenuation protein / uracil phosphoribosyltransferase